MSAAWLCWILPHRWTYEGGRAGPLAWRVRHCTRCPAREQFIPSEQGQHYGVDEGAWVPLKRPNGR